MNKQLMWVAAGLAVCGTVVSSVGCAKAQAQRTGGEARESREIQLTIYKEDFALVHEARPVSLDSGRTRLHLDSISKTLDPKTVIFDWQDGSKADVVSNAYDLGVPSGGALLKRLEGKPVEMLWNSQDGKPGDKIDGTLEAAQDGSFVIRSGEKLYVNPNGTIVAGGDQNLVTMPRLTAEVDNPSKEEAKLGFAYQTRGMSWSADYVGRLSPDGNALNFECWATLENHTGVDFPDAKITLVAGSPNRVARSPQTYEYEAARPMDQSGFSGAGIAKREMTPTSVGELYAYKVPSNASVGQEQMNRVKMLSSERVPIVKDYNIRLDDAGSYFYGYGNQNPRRQNAVLSIALTNDEKSGLGQPLPAGAIRIYDATSSDSTAFVGAAGLDDTPKNQHVNLTLSKVFDVYSDSLLSSSKKVDKHTVRKTFEAVVHNEKKSAVDVRIVQTFYGKKHLASESDKGVQLDASTRQWTIRIEAGGQKKLTWTADFGN